MECEADVLALKRQRNREAQRRSREKKRRAHQAALTVRLAEARLALASAAAELFAKRRDSAGLRQRLFEAATLAPTLPATEAPHPEVTRVQTPTQCAHNRRQQSRSGASGPPSMPLGRPGGVPTSAGPHAPFAGNQGTAARGPRDGQAAVDDREPCAIFIDTSARRHRHVEFISRSRMRCDGLGMEARIDAFRAAAAQRLGCDEREILWLFESDSVPALTRASGLRMLVDTPDSIARSSMLWIVGQLEVLLRHCISTRLEARLRQLQQPLVVDDAAVQGPRAADSQDGSRQRGGPTTHLPPSVLDPAPSPPGDCDSDRGPRASPSRSTPDHGRHASLTPSLTAEGGEAGTAQPDDSLTDLMLGIYAANGGERDAPPSPEHAPSASEPACSTVADALALAQHVFGGVLQSILPHAHPADVMRTARRFRATYRLEGGRAPRGAQLTMGLAFASVLEGAHRALQAACAHVCTQPAVPELPASVVEVKALIAEHHWRASSATLDVRAFWYICSIDRPEYSIQVESGLQSSRRWRWTMTLEELSCYCSLALHTQQKLQLAALLAEHRARVAELDREHATSLNALERLLACSDVFTLDFDRDGSGARAPVALTAAGSAPTPSHSAHWPISRSEERPASEADAAAPHGLSGLPQTSPHPSHVLADRPTPAPLRLEPGAELWHRLRWPMPMPDASAAEVATAPDEAPAALHGAFSGRPLTPEPGPPPCRRLGWPQRLLGASAEETAAAGLSLGNLRGVQRKRQHLRMRTTGGIKDVLTWGQYATLWTGFQPKIDRFALCEMATADVRCDRAFSRIAIAAPGARGCGG